jgi:hypothetical protein
MAKIKMDFITNSSSTGYILVVHAKRLTAKEFVNEMWDSLKKEMKEYDFEYTKEEIITTLDMGYDYFPCTKGTYNIEFGDDNGSAAGRVFDYCLRGGVHTNKFHVKFRESLR